jgi:hypothetical protein
MAIQWGKMILHGLLSAVFYIGIPYGLIYLLEYLNLITFTESFKIAIIIFGALGTVISMIKHAYPKDTSANRLISFFISIYSGIYLFYIFGGFEPGVELGTYSINTSLLQVTLGLKLIAWLLLAATAIRGLQYLVEAIELRKNKRYNVKVKKQFRLSSLFKAFGFLMSLVIIGYFASVIFSGMNLKPIIHPDFVPGYNNKGTPTPADDTINMTVTFDMINNGIYAVYDVNLSMGVFTETTANSSALPEYTKIGESPNHFYPAFHSFTQTLNQTITIDINPLYAPGLVTTDATLRFQISFETVYALIYINLNISITSPWTALI